MTLGGARVWAGDFDGARPFLEQAERLAPDEGHSFVQAVAPILSAIAHIEDNNTAAAHAEAARAIDIATQHGLSDLAQTALAHSVVARTTEEADDAVTAAQRGVELARRSPERITYAYALASGGDVLCHHDHPHGADLIAEARDASSACAQTQGLPAGTSPASRPATSSAHRNRQRRSSSRTSPSANSQSFAISPPRCHNARSPTSSTSR